MDLYFHALGLVPKSGIVGSDCMHVTNVLSPSSKFTFHSLLYKNETGPFKSCLLLAGEALPAVKLEETLRGKELFFLVQVCSPHVPTVQIASPAPTLFREVVSPVQLASASSSSCSGGSSLIRSIHNAPGSTLPGDHQLPPKTTQEVSWYPVHSFSCALEGVFSAKKSKQLPAIQRVKVTPSPAKFRLQSRMGRG